MSYATSDDSDKSNVSEEIIYKCNTDQLQFKAAAKKLLSSQCFNGTANYSERSGANSVHQVPQSGPIMTEDDFSEVEIGADGQRIYRPRPSRSHLYRSSVSRSISVCTGYSSQSRNHHLRSHRSTTPLSIQSNKTINPYDRRALLRSVRDAVDLNIVLPQDILKLYQECAYPSRKRRKRGRSRGSQDEIDGSSEEERHSTRSEFAMHPFKKARNSLRRPFSRNETYKQSQREVPFSSSRLNTSTMSLINEGSCSRKNYFSSARSFTGFSNMGSVQNTKFQAQNSKRSIGNLSMQPQPSQPSTGNLTLQLQGLRPPPITQQFDLRNLSCTEVTVAEPSQAPKTLDNAKEMQQEDHVFLKPKSFPEPKKILPVAPALPSKHNLTQNRLSDVSEIPELTQDYSNESMRPSFIKRKLYTQTLDLALEHDQQNDDSLPLNSPVPNIYSSVPRPKNKTSHFLPRPLLKKNIFDNAITGNQSEIRNLIEQIVPQEKMNATTGILQKNSVRSSIHEALSIKNKENQIMKLSNGNEQCLDYDSDIFVPLQDLQKQNNITEPNEHEKNDELPQLINEKSALPKNVEATKQYTNNQNKISHRKYKNHDQSRNESTDIPDLNSEPSVIKPTNTLDRLQNSITNCVTNPSNRVLNKLTQSHKDENVTNKRMTNSKNSLQNPLKKNDASKKIDENKKFYNNLHKSLDNALPKSVGAKGKETANSDVKMNKRAAMNKGVNKPSKLMKTSDTTKKVCHNKQPVITSEDEDPEVSFRQDVSTTRQSSRRTLTPNNNSLDIGVRRDARNISTYNTHGVRRSARKKSRPSKYFDFSLENSPQASNNENNVNSRSDDKCAKRTTRASKNGQPSPTFTASECDRTMSPGKTPTTRKQVTNKYVTNTGGKRIQQQKETKAGGSKQRPVTDKHRAMSPTFTASDPEDLVSSQVTPARGKVADQGAGSSGCRRIQPARNVNSVGRKKPPSPTYKVQKQRISFGRKAKSHQSTQQTERAKENGQPKGKVDRWFYDSSEDEKDGKAAVNTCESISRKPLESVAVASKTRGATTTQLLKETPLTVAPTDEVKTKSSVNADSKPSHTFKAPFVMLKALPNKVSVSGKALRNSVQPKRGAPKKDTSSMSILSSRSTVNASRGNRSVLPAKIRALLPSDWEDDCSEEDDNRSTIRDRVNKLSGNENRLPKPSRKRQRDGVSPARSHKSTKSEMARGAKAAEGARQGSVMNARRADTRSVRSVQQLGMSTVTIGNIPSFCRQLDVTRNVNRLGDNVSVMSGRSLKSTSSIGSLSRSLLLHF